jgi:outer membrane protein insertion porin family
MEQGSSALIRVLPLLLVALLRCGNLKASAADTLWGRTVLDIRLEGDAHLPLAEFSAEITQKKGEPLDRSKVAESLKNLYATGRFQELAAQTEPERQGIVLVFRAKARYFVGVVRVEGAPKGLDPSALASAARLSLGQPLTEDALNQAAARITSALADNASYRPRVSTHLSRHPDSQEADVVFLVETQPPARLEEVDFSGNLAVPPATLLRVARWRRGIPLTSTRLQRGLSRLHQFYAKRGRLQAAADAKRAYDAKKNTERLTVHVDAGPEIRIHVTGTHISAATLRRILPAYLQASADDLTLLDGERALEDYLERQGRFSARATLAEKRATGGGSLDVTYRVDPGPRGQFVGYAFHGNRSIPSSDLASAVKLQRAATLQFHHGQFDRDLLDGSVRALTELYHTRGFAQAQITPALEESYQGRPHHLFVTFNIEEGSQTRVGQVTIDGVSEADQLQMGSFLLTGPGQPYSPERARQDRDAILTYLANRGYSQARVDWHASEPSANHEVSVAYHVNPGPQQRIARVVLLGNAHTRSGVIDRQLTFGAGQPLNQSGLLESQNRLYDLGIFNQVQIATQDPGSPETEETVLVGVEEAKRWTVVYGGGLDVQRLPGNGAEGTYGVSPRVSLELDRLDVDGRPQTFTLRGHFSNLEKIGSTGYTIPRFLNHPGLSLQFQVLADQSRDVLTFNSKRQEGSITLQKRYGPHASLLARYDFRRVSVSNLQINPAEVPLLSQPVLVATLGGSYINDHRDNPVDATRGSYSVVDANLAWKGFGSSADFLRITGQNSTYYRLGPHLVFARNTRLGVEPAFGTSSEPEGVPLPERFFMGGSDSLRAFSLNQAGPRDPVTGFPIGGKALFLNQVEMRFPLQDQLGFVLFEDAGNAYSSLSTLRLLKVSQSSPTDFDYTVHAAGVGVRYRTPVGPLRFDVAYSPNVPQFQMCTLSASVCPAGDLEVLRLPRFQFFISIGQSF